MDIKVSRCLYARFWSFSAPLVGPQKHQGLGLARALGITADNLDAVGMDLVGVVELEIDIFDDKGPDVVAKAVGIEVALGMAHQHGEGASFPPSTDLECQTVLDLVSKHICNCLVEVDQDLHGQLGLDPSLGDQTVERIRKGAAQTVFVSQLARDSRAEGAHCTCFGGRARSTWSGPPC